MKTYVNSTGRKIIVQDNVKLAGGWTLLENKVEKKQDQKADIVENVEGGAVPSVENEKKSTRSKSKKNKKTK
jgi:hypothetical protein